LKGVRRAELSGGARAGKWNPVGSILRGWMIIPKP
jgi:hypothetical protein